MIKHIVGTYSSKTVLKIFKNFILKSVIWFLNDLTNFFNFRSHAIPLIAKPLQKQQDCFDEVLCKPSEKNSRK